MKKTLVLVFIAVCALVRADSPRLVVASFRSATGDTFNWNGKPDSTSMWCDSLANRLCELFTQSGRFTVIDRKFDAEVKDEIARLSDKNADKGDVVRLGRRLGTDYMIVGDVRFGGAAPSSAANPITGQTMAIPPQRFAEASCRMILVSTGEIKWADTVAVDVAEVAATDMLTFVSGSTDLAAHRVVDAVVANCFPSDGACQDGRCVMGGAVSPPVEPPPPTSVRGTGNGGVVTPF